MDAFTSSGNYLGTDRIGRALTDEDSGRLGRLLREHDFPGRSMVALRFAYKLRREHGGAQDLLGRVRVRLVCGGWDPNAVTLVKRLCRLVWSEYTHEVEESAAARRAEEMFLREEGAEGDVRPGSVTRGDPLRPAPKEPVAPSYEQQLGRLAAERAHDAECVRSVAEFQGTFRGNADAVNQAWMDCRLRGIDDLDAMCAEKGYSKDEFYAAQKRRQRAVRNVLAKRHGVAPDDEEKD